MVPLEDLIKINNDDMTEVVGIKPPSGHLHHFFPKKFNKVCDKVWFSNVL